MAYIEENMKKRRGAPDAPATVDPADPYAELHRLADKYKRKQAGKEEEGSVAGSLAMLTAIPEVDLGMECVTMPPLLCYRTVIINYDLNPVHDSKT